MQTKTHIIASLRARLTDDRFIHSLNVADMARELALIYGEDPEKAYLAGLVHDCTKNTAPEKQLELMARGGIILTALERSNKKLWHAMSGSVFIQEAYGIDDPAIIAAVRYHTTGKAAMSLLEKIVYTADFTSAERDYPEVEHIRHLARTALDRAVYEGALFTVEKLGAAGKDIHPDTIEAMQYYSADNAAR